MYWTPECIVKAQTVNRNIAMHMKTWINAIFLGTLVLTMGSGRAADESTTVIHAGTIIVVPGESPLTEQSVVVSGGKIKDIVRGYLPAEAGATVIDLRDAYLMPGFIDMHAHATGGGELGDPYRNLAEAVRKDKFERAFESVAYAEALLMKGFTTIKDVGDNGDGLSYALRDAIAKGQIVGPRVLAAGPMIGPTGTQIDVWGYREEFQEAFDRVNFGVCDGADACRQLIRENVKRGADAIKIKNTGGIGCIFPGSGDPRFTPDELTAIIQTAHQLNRKVTAHAICTDGINEALRAGVDSVEHATMMNDESIDLFKESGAFLVGTLLAPTATLEQLQTDNEELRQTLKMMNDHMMNMYGKAYKAGVNIAFGTDTGYTPHDMVSREFLLMAEAGMTPADVIRAATVNAATLLGRDKQIGTLEKGKIADLVATPTDPLADISALTNISFVMKQGEIYKHERN
jgi:imidazolonepropionase-like amidohydrolase